MKQIIFTIIKNTDSVTVKTKSLLADKKDKEIITYAVMLLTTMNKLTDKYNQRGVAVLFEVE